MLPRGALSVQIGIYSCNMTACLNKLLWQQRLCCYIMFIYGDMCILQATILLRNQCLAQFADYNVDQRCCLCRKCFHAMTISCRFQTGDDLFKTFRQDVTLLKDLGYIEWHRCPHHKLKLLSRKPCFLLYRLTYYTRILYYNMQPAVLVMPFAI